MELSANQVLLTGSNIFKRFVILLKKTNTKENMARFRDIIVPSDQGVWIASAVHLDNTPAHTPNLNRQFYSSKQILPVSHAPYFPYLALKDFLYSQRWKSMWAIVNSTP